MSEKYSRKEISDMQQKEGWNVKMQVKYKYLRWNTWVNVLSYSPPLCLPEVRAASSSSSSSGLMTAATSRSGRSQWNLERADGLNRHVSSQDRLCYFITVLSYIHLTALVTCYFSDYPPPLPAPVTTVVYCAGSLISLKSVTVIWICIIIMDNHWNKQDKTISKYVY